MGNKKTTNLTRDMSNLVGQSLHLWVCTFQSPFSREQRPPWKLILNTLCWSNGTLSTCQYQAPRSWHVAKLVDFMFLSTTSNMLYWKEWEGVRSRAAPCQSLRANICSTWADTGPNQDIYCFISSHVIKRSLRGPEKERFLCQRDPVFIAGSYLPLTSCMNLGS